MKKMCALIVCMTVCGVALFAQTEAGFDTTADGDGVVITKYTGPGGDVVIPATIGGKAVVGIDKEAFRGNKSLTSVTIPGSVNDIGSEAFRGCTGLKTVTILSGVTVIGDRAFSFCTGLKTITIPGSVKDIGVGLFSAVPA